MLYLLICLLFSSVHLFADTTSQLTDLCTTLHMIDKTSGFKVVSFPYLGVSDDFRLYLPNSSLPQPVGDIIPIVAGEVNVPNLQQAQGVWPEGVVNYVNPRTGQNIKFSEIFAGPDGTNCGWHALKNCLCLLNVRFRPADEKGKFLQDMQSPQVFVDLLKLWLEFALPYRMINAPGQYALYPLGNWPSEDELEAALGRLPGVVGYDDQFAAINDALAAYKWDEGIDLRDYVSIVSRFAAFSDYKKMKEEHLEVLKKVCLSDSADHAFVVNTSANSLHGSGFHWVEFFLHKVDGHITWYNSDSLGANVYQGLQDTLTAIFSKTPEEIADLERKVLYNAMIEISARLVETAMDLNVENQYNFRGLLIKDAAIGRSDVLTKEDLVVLGFAEKVEDVSDALLHQQIVNMQKRAFDLSYLRVPRSMVFASFYNPVRKEWFISYENQSKPVDLKLASLPIAATRHDSLSPLRGEVAQIMVKDVQEDKRAAAFDQLIAQAATIVVPLQDYWFCSYSKKKLAILDADTDHPTIRFYNPDFVINNCFEQIWKDGYNPASLLGDSILMKDKNVWPGDVKQNCLHAMAIVVQWVVDHPDKWSLNSDITINGIPDTRGVAKVDQHDPPLFGDVTFKLGEWIFMTMRKVMPMVLVGNDQDMFNHLVANLRLMDSKLADRVQALDASV